MLLTILAIWTLVAIVLATLLCRLIHKSKVRDELGAGLNGVMFA